MQPPSSAYPVENGPEEGGTEEIGTLQNAVETCFSCPVSLGFLPCAVHPEEHPAVSRGVSVCPCVLSGTDGSFVLCPPPPTQDLKME